MSKYWHRGIVAASSIGTALAAFWAATDASSLALSPTTFAWTAVVLAVVNIVVTGIRQASDSE